MTRELEVRAERELAAVRSHAQALRTQLRDTNPLLWLGGGVLAGAVAARVAGARGRKAGAAPLTLLAGLAEGYALRALKPWLERLREPDTDAGDAR